VGLAVAAEFSSNGDAYSGKGKVKAVTGSQRRGTYGREVGAYQVDGATKEAARRGMALSPRGKIYRTTVNGPLMTETRKRGNAIAQRLPDRAHQTARRRGRGFASDGRAPVIGCAPASGWLGWPTCLRRSVSWPARGKS
jgi:hypothetical protein